jgi:hypothetical protein
MQRRAKTEASLPPSFIAINLTLAGAVKRDNRRSISAGRKSVLVTSNSSVDLRSATDAVVLDQDAAMNFELATVQPSSIPILKQVKPSNFETNAIESGFRHTQT